MAVFVEATSVIIRREAINKRFKGGWEKFTPFVLNGTLCYDDDLARVGFMSPADVEVFSSLLVDNGLVYTRDGEPIDFAIVEQNGGPVLSTPWLSFGTIAVEGSVVMACWLEGKTPTSLVFPKDWDPQRPRSVDTVDTDTLSKRYVYLQHQNGSDVYMDTNTGKKVYSGRVYDVVENSDTIIDQVEQIWAEVRGIGNQMADARTKKDDALLSELMDRLNNVLLPQITPFAQGPGRRLPTAHFTTGYILMLLDRLPEAEDEFRTAVKLSPESVSSLNELVYCLGKQGKDEEAIPFAKESVRKNPAQPNSWANLALCLLTCWRRDEALAAVKHAIELNPNDYSYLGLLARIDRSGSKEQVKRLTKKASVIDSLFSFLGPGKDGTEIVNKKDGSILIVIPPGPFIMGADHDSENPVRVISTKRYCIGKYPVTVGQFRRFIDDTGYITDAENGGGSDVYIGDKLVFKKDANWRKPYVKQTDGHPVVCVSSNDARAYCLWAGLRLPSEMEWEKAARGVDGYDFPWGSDWDPSRCNNAERDRKFKSSGTTPVEQYSGSASPFGVVDMVGNVWEWCSDEMLDKGSAKDSYLLPDGMFDIKTMVEMMDNPQLLIKQQYIVFMHGASWRSICAAACICANRAAGCYDYRDNAHGFRVAK